MLLRLLIIVGFLLVPLSAHAQTATWEAPYRGDDPKLLYLPDTKATYWRYGWKRKPGDTSGIIIKGKTPNARYFSYNVYNDDTKSTLGSFTDFQLATDDGSINPFTGKGDGTAANYTIVVLPKGTKTDAKNVLYFPDELTNVSVFLRHYVAEGGIEGGVPMPTVAIYNPDNQTATTAPASNKVPALSKQEAQKYLVPMLKRLIVEFENNPKALIQKLESKRTGGPLNMKELIASQVVGKAFNLFKPGDKHYSLRLQTAGTYPNQDNYYLGLPIIRTKEQSLLVRFKAPKLTTAPADFPDADVRFFSLSQGDEYSYTHGTVLDADMKIDADGFANFIIADETPEMIEKAKALGANFMPWKTGEKMLLIYRHMLPSANFKQGIDKVASFDPKKPAKDQIAIKTIGAYALTGKLVPTSSLSALSEFPKF